MTHDEAVKMIREALRVAAMWIPDDSSGDTKTLFKSIAALDSLASETEALRKRIAELELDNREGAELLAMQDRKLAVEPSEDAREFAQKMTSGHWPNMQEYHDYLVTLIISRDERMRREERERCAWQVEHYVSGRIVEIDDLKAAIMGGKK